LFLPVVSGEWFGNGWAGALYTQVADVREFRRRETSITFKATFLWEWFVFLLVW
jgi:hypothetical protein